MADAFQIPLEPKKPQRFTVTLGGADYQLTLKHWAVAEGGWTVDIADASGNPILFGVPLITGADLLAQHKHLGIPGELRVQSLVNSDAVPTFETLGTDSVLLWIPESSSV